MPATRPQRHFFPPLACAVALIAASIGFAATSQPASAASTTASGFTTSAAADQSTVVPGSPVRITTAVTAEARRTALVDVEVYSAGAVKVHQRYWNRQSFTAGATRTFTTTWTVPSEMATGTYTVRIGVFSSGWYGLYHWNNSATTLNVVSGTPATTTPATTTPPTSATTTPATTTPATTTPATTTPATTTPATTTPATTTPPTSATTTPATTTPATTTPATTTPATTTPATTTPATTTTMPGMTGTTIPAAQLPVGNPGSNQILIRNSAQQDESSDSSGNFRLFCGFSHMSYDDPIVFPGQTGVSHLHAFFGNTSTDANSTHDTLRADGNGTCSGGAANKSAYWTPVLMNNGVPMKPKYSQVYYKSGYRSVKPNQINYIPDGLVMIAGNKASTADQSDEIVSWECTGQDTYKTHLWSCGNGNEMSMTLIFPQCWDGVHLDSPDHMSHMAYPTYGKGCPADHPVAIPVISFMQYWDQPATSITGLRLSSDMPGIAPGVSAHADYMEGWDPTIAHGWTDNCIRAHRDCTRGLGDARQLVDPPGITFD